VEAGSAPIVTKGDASRVATTPTHVAACTPPPGRAGSSPTQARTRSTCSPAAFRDCTPPHRRWWRFPWLLRRRCSLT